MRLYDLLENNVTTALDNIDISMITDNTGKVCEGCLFVCIKGSRFDGHSAAADMLEKGAAAVAVERDLGLGERQIVVEDTRDFYGKLCSAWFSHPEKKIKLIGVTGTNGKTTITNAIKYILMQNGHKTGLIGTIQNEIGDEIIPAANTTPFVFELMELFDRMAKAGCEYVVMEVSSFGLSQKRIGSSHFETSVFTNLTQDHLDYHKDMEDYYLAKKMLFNICDQAICNIDDDYGKRLFNEISCTKYTYGCNTNSDFYADGIKARVDGSSFWLCFGDKSHYVTIKMPGMFNVSNMTAAIAVCVRSGLPIEDVIDAASKYSGVRGRCEIIPTGRDFTVICDYAHTPDALDNVLKSVKEYTEGRLICLFGCGGNRDTAKRPKMALAAANHADFLVITSDNPRDEEPQSIIDEIIAGLEDTTVPYKAITDRRDAIYYALENAQPGDVIVLAGKGHEDYQVLANGEQIHFDEREVVAKAIKSMSLDM